MNEVTNEVTNDQITIMFKTSLAKWLSENGTNVKSDDIKFKHEFEKTSSWVVNTKKAKLVILFSGGDYQVFEAKNYYCGLECMVDAMRTYMGENGLDLPPHLNNKYGGEQLSPFSKKDVRFDRGVELSDMPFLTGKLTSKGNGGAFIKNTIVEESF